MMLLSWLCGGLFALCGALCYGEMGAKFPHAGCEYVFLRESFGKLMGFLSGWISLLVGFSAPIAAAAIAFSTYCFRAFGITVGPNIPIEVFGVPVAVISMVNLTAIMVIVGFSLLHYHSLVNGSRIQNCLTVFNFFLVFVFIIAGFAFGHGSTAYFLETSGMRDFSAESFAVALIFVSFFYSGWNAAGAYLLLPHVRISFYPLGFYYGKPMDHYLQDQEPPGQRIVRSCHNRSRISDLWIFCPERKGG